MSFGTEARREREKFELQTRSVTKNIKHSFNGTSEMTLIQLSFKKILSCLCSRVAFAILYCSRIFRVRRWFSLWECKTRRRYLKGTTSSFENPGRESKVVCKLLVWLPDLEINRLHRKEFRTERCGGVDDQTSFFLLSCVLDNSTTKPFFDRFWIGFKISLKCFSVL